jgi:hypothetical protein
MDEHLRAERVVCKIKKVRILKLSDGHPYEEALK